MKLRYTFRTQIFLLLMLLAIPALACTTLLGGSDDSETAESAAEPQQDATAEEQGLPGDDVGDGEGTGSTAEPSAGSGETARSSRETIADALRTGLEIDRMRMNIISEELGSGQVTEITLAFVRPDRYHLISEGLELIVIEDTTYLKGPDGKWTSRPGTEMIGTVEGTLSAFAGEAAIQERLDTLSESDVSVEGRETINGVETEIYSFSEGVDGSSIFGQVRMWIGVEDGLLYRQEIESELSGVGTRATMEFEYGDSVVVEAPEL